MKYQTYFETQYQTLQEFYRYLDNSIYTYEPIDCLQCEHINYDTTHTYHLPLITKKGNPAKKWAHASICRLSSGRYELIMHIA